MSKRFIFWQNINSMHQSAFLKALAMRYEVTLVTARTGTGREEMGWSEPDLPGVKVLHIREIDWKDLIRRHAGPEDCHVFAGLHAFAPVHAALQEAMRHACRIGVYAEPLVMRGPAGLLKQFRGYFDRVWYAPRLDFVLCIGPACRRQYLGWGFAAERLYPWAYVTEACPEPLPVAEANRPIRIIFPASFIRRKGADILLQAVSRLPPSHPFEFIGYSMPHGDLDAFQRRWQDRIKDFPHIRLLPYTNNADVRRALAAADLMVLPSRFDGWGAAVNESLMAGTPVLVSDRCGAASVIAGKELLGSVFGPPDVGSLTAALARTLQEGHPSPERRLSIRIWAEQHLSGQALADHFLQITNAAVREGIPSTTAPWDTMPPMVVNTFEPIPLP